MNVEEYVIIVHIQLKTENLTLQINLFKNGLTCNKRQSLLVVDYV